MLQNSNIDKTSIINDLYQVSVVSLLAIGYSMLNKKLSYQKFDLEDMEKLLAIVAAPEMTGEYLIKQKILREQINV